MDIRQAGDPVLRAQAAPVEKNEFGTAPLTELLSRMNNVLDGEHDGVALAAPQIGAVKRIFVVRYDRMLPPPKEGEAERAPDRGVFINPTIIRRSRKKEIVEEGCLSVRGTYGKTRRNERATVRAYDELGKKFERGGGGILAQAFQHEIDHLDGILFIDHAEDLFEILGDEKPLLP